MDKDHTAELIYLQQLHAGQIQKLNDILELLHDIQDKLITLGYKPAATALAVTEENTLKTALLRFEV